MEWKKTYLQEHFLWPRKKVLSGFGLGIAVSVIVLALFFLNNSLKGSSVEPMLQGFQSASAHASFVSEYFSAPTISRSSFSSANTSTASELQSSVDFVHNIEEPRVLNKTQYGNSTLNGNLDGDKVKGEILEKTHLGNSSQQVKNGSFTDENGTLQQQTQEPNLPIFARNTDLLNPVVGKERDIGNLSEKQDVEAGKAIVDTIVNNSSNVNNNASVITSFSSLGEEGKASTEKNNRVISNYSQLQKMQSGSYETCDIFDGRWVRDNSKPYYPRGSCPFIDRDFNCRINGRPDHGYVKWKWQPNGCDIPNLNATDFLEILRSKRLVYVGDSLNRNMWESLVCILRQSLRYKRRVHEISGRTEFKKKGVYAFRFEDYNCSVDFVASPFLVRESSFSGENGTFETLRLDLMDKTTSTYHDADIIVFNTGHWWTHEKTSKGEDYYQEGNYVHPRLKVLEAYKRALTTWARWIDKNIDCNRTLVFFRGYSATHFSGGQWNSGGQCHKEIEPIFNKTYLNKYPSKMRALEYVIREMKTPVVYLNITSLTDYRKDGHPSIYRTKYKTVEEQIAAERSQDCSHWCLPGVPDTWNELLYASILKARGGS